MDEMHQIGAKGSNTCRAIHQDPQRNTPSSEGSGSAKSLQWLGGGSPRQSVNVSVSDQTALGWTLRSKGRGGGRERLQQCGWWPTGDMGSWGHGWWGQRGATGANARAQGVRRKGDYSVFRCFASASPYKNAWTMMMKFSPALMRGQASV